MSDEVPKLKVKKEKKIKAEAGEASAEVVEKKEKKEKKDKKRKAVELDLKPEVKEIEPETKVEGEGEVEETKEERKARKKAKKEAKSAAAAAKSGEAPKLESALASSTSDPAPSKEETKEERKARRRAEKLAKEVSNQPTTNESEVPKPASIPSDEISLKKKKAQAKAEGPTKAERKAKGAEKWSGAASELNQAMQARAEESPIWEDESLSEQAKKGLYYCELHAANQVKLQEPNYRWKFNKARQGWLMRNVWNDTEIPDEYLDGVVNYLKTLPGSARALMDKGMIATAKKYASATVKSTEEPLEAVEAGQAATEAAEAQNGKDEEEEEEKDKEDSASVEMRKIRAQKILKALGAR